MRKIARARVFVYVFVCVLCVWGGGVEKRQREKEREREHYRDRTRESTGLNLCTNEHFRDFFVAKVFFYTENVKSENFMHSEWSEKKKLKGSVGHRIRLRFRNKCEMTHLLLMQLASYRKVLARELKYLARELK